MALCHLMSFSCATVWNRFHSSVFGVQTSDWKVTHSFPVFKIVCIACYGENCGSDLKQSRETKPIKSNAELCSEIREFNSMVGLPENHVPSLKELFRHGRKDLANIVRRRGYKVIAELLMDMTKVDTNLMINNAENPDTNFRTNENFNNSTGGPLYRKAAKFIQSGDLNPILDIDGTAVSNKCDDFENGQVVELLVDNQANPVSVTLRNRADVNSNGAFMESKDIDLRVKTCASYRENAFTSGGLNSVQLDNYLFDEPIKAGKQNEIEHLKLMLQEKEAELSQLKQLIEKEKLALTSLQEKTNIQIENAQRIIAKKDAELDVVEKSLLGLREVWIDYWGTGESVELAGSFNGWHNPIKMNICRLTEIRDQDGSSNSVFWSIALWLYPGIYEIKFIVDGHWRVDPQREIITIGHIQNNVLRVEK